MKRSTMDETRAICDLGRRMLSRLPLTSGCHKRMRCFVICYGSICCGVRCYAVMCDDMCDTDVCDAVMCDAVRCGDYRGETFENAI